ncbi:MAG TPA: heme o synthase [Longimicrobiales bacterium]|nr:heme o synthase [Longimicrobiales bacterium]
MSVVTSAPTAAPAPRASYRTVFGDLASLTKPGITRLVVFTTAAGFLMAAGRASDLFLLLHTVIGAGFAAAGANALNMWWERETDRFMTRTAARPLPAGRLSARAALLFALAISAFGLAYLALLVNLAAVVLVAASLLSYVLVYTPLKRRTHHATLIGATPGALPILAGWVATGAAIGPSALSLFGVVFLWQMPHFYALAWVYRDDYGRGGLRMLSVVDPVGSRIGLESTLYSAALLAVSLVPVATGLLGWVYGAGAVVLGLWMVALSARLWRVRNDRRAWRLFFASIVYLPVLLALMLLDRFLV